MVPLGNSSDNTICSGGTSGGIPSGANTGSDSDLGHGR